MEQADIDAAGAKLAYTIIQSLLDGHEALSDLLVVMSHALDQDTLKALTATAEWERYLLTRREMEGTRHRIEGFTTVLKNMEDVPKN